jgi:hypothetical protein
MLDASDKRNQVGQVMASAGQDMKALCRDQRVSSRVSDVGEINNMPLEILAEDHELSIMPEFLHFHEFFEQGDLS